MLSPLSLLSTALPPPPPPSPLLAAPYSTNTITMSVITIPLHYITTNPTIIVIITDVASLPPPGYVSPKLLIWLSHYNILHVTAEAGSLPSLVLADAEYRHPLRHHRKRAPCWANPCQGGGTCLNGPHPSRPMLCICPPDREGTHNTLSYSHSTDLSMFETWNSYKGRLRR